VYLWLLPRTSFNHSIAFSTLSGFHIPRWSLFATTFILPKSSIGRIAFVQCPVFLSGSTASSTHLGSALAGSTQVGWFLAPQSYRCKRLKFPLSHQLHAVPHMRSIEADLRMVEWVFGEAWQGMCADNLLVGGANLGADRLYEPKGMTGRCELTPVLRCQLGEWFGR
jgi:hypothetical protein